MNLSYIVLERSFYVTAAPMILVFIHEKPLLGQRGGLGAIPWGGGRNTERLALLSALLYM